MLSTPIISLPYSSGFTAILLIMPRTLHSPRQGDSRSSSFNLLHWLKPGLRRTSVRFSPPCCPQLIEILTPFTALVRKYDMSQSIRYISDNAPLYEDAGSLTTIRISRKHRQIFNLTSGENIIRYLRGQFYRAPVLVYCASGSSISVTRYVSSYPMACSTRSKSVLRQYISSLAGRVHDNEEWHGCDVVVPASNRTENEFRRNACQM